MAFVSLCNRKTKTIIVLDLIWSNCQLEQLSKWDYFCTETRHIIESQICSVLEAQRAFCCQLLTGEQNGKRSVLSENIWFCLQFHCCEVHNQIFMSLFKPYFVSSL